MPIALKICTVRSNRVHLGLRSAWVVSHLPILFMSPHQLCSMNAIDMNHQRIYTRTNSATFYLRFVKTLVLTVIPQFLCNFFMTFWHLIEAFLHACLLLVVATCRDDKPQALKCQKVVKKLHRMWNWDDIKKRLASGRVEAMTEQHRFKLNWCECCFTDLKKTPQV